MNDIEERVQQRARELWKQAGRPAGGFEAYVDRASELAAIEDKQLQPTKPLSPAERAGAEGEQIAASVGPEGESVEPAEVMENVGEFPNLTPISGNCKSPPFGMRPSLGHRPSFPGHQLLR